VNDIVVHPGDPSLLFVATDTGVYVCSDSQWVWSPVGRGLPNSAVHDLELVVETNELVAGTHGRSMFRIDLTELVADEPVRPDAATLTLNAFPNPASERDRLIRVSYHLSASIPGGSNDAATLRIIDLGGRELSALSPVQIAAEDVPGLFQWDRTTRAGTHRTTRDLCTPSRARPTSRLLPSRAHALTSIRPTAPSCRARFPLLASPGNQREARCLNALRAAVVKTIPLTK
jgi:hypothetical protein